jgi:predicted ATPase
LRRLGGGAYAGVLDEHRQIIRAGLAAHGGREDGSQGDSFFATFTSPSACVEAAVAMQRALNDHVWPESEGVLVRMGIHTGEVTETSTGLVGLEVHRASRVGAVAHGGQVLLSSAAAGLVEDSLPEDFALRDLGAHRLKDLGRPETLFQLEAPGLRLQFPPLRSLDNPEMANNFPASLSPFVGRVADVAEVVALIQSARLVTLTGAGGSGKTRLALQASAEVLDGSGEGVWFVELAPVSDPDQVATTIVTALRLRGEATDSDHDVLLRALHEQYCLIILDNCEHLIDDVAKLADLITRTCPRVSLVVTSREPLGVDGEEVYRVRSLSLPPREIESVEDLGRSDAVDLFVARTRSHDKAFAVTDAVAPLIASVCRRLDGIPLAIELAAARLTSMSLDDLHERLDQRFRLLTGGSRNALPRQQTLAAMVGWSYDLLSEPERVVLRRLTVFVNGFTLKAAEAVCASEDLNSFDVSDILGSLVLKSLVNTERSAGSLRYSLLETIRQYAGEQLIQSDGEPAALDVRRLHAEYFLARCEAEFGFLGVDRAQAAALRRLDAEAENVQMALSTFSSDGEASKVIRLCRACWVFFATRGLREALDVLRVAIDGPDVPGTERAVGLMIIADLSLQLFATSPGGEIQMKERHRNEMLDEAVAILRRDGPSEYAAAALAMRAEIFFNRSDEGLSRALSAEAVELARASGDVDILGWTLLLQAVAFGFGSEDQGGPYYRAAREAFEECGDLRGRCGALLTGSYGAYSNLEELAETRRMHEEARELSKEMGSVTAETEIWDNLSLYCFLLGDATEASDYARRSLASKRRMGQSLWAMPLSLFVLSGCAHQSGDHSRAARIFGAFERAEAELPRTLRLNGSWTDLDLRAQADLRTGLVETLGLGVFEAEAALGRQMSTNDVVDEALGRNRSGD